MYKLPPRCGMILAAGRGHRMGALTEHTPKPLLKVAGRYLIEYAIQSFVAAGIHEIVINISYHKEQIKAALGDGSRYGVKIIYSVEEQRLETGGGIVQALAALGSEPFVVLSCDIITDYPIIQLYQRPLRLAHLVLVENPIYNLKGDFSLNNNNEIIIATENPYTFASMGLYHPKLFSGYSATHCRLPDIWKEPLMQKQVTGEVYKGFWYNVGTPQELFTAETALS